MSSIKNVEKIKTNIVLPANLVFAIEEITKKRKRSQFVVEAIREKIGRIKAQKALEESAGCWKAENHPELKTQRDINKYLKKARAATNHRIWKALTNEKLSS